MVTLFVGIFLGIILGSIPLAIPGMSVPMKLGLAGGPLVVAILLGRFGHKIHLVTYTSTGASLMLREIGICLFLASVGISAGGEFVNTIMSGGTHLGYGWGFLITVIPLLISEYCPGTRTRSTIALSWDYFQEHVPIPPPSPMATRYRGTMPHR